MPRAECDGGPDELGQMSGGHVCSRPGAAWAEAGGRALCQPLSGAEESQRNLELRGDGSAGPSDPTVVSRKEHSPGNQNAGATDTSVHTCFLSVKRFPRKVGSCTYLLLAPSPQPYGVALPFISKQKAV